MPLSIGEAASRSGLPPKTIRYYEQIGLIAPAARGENRYRAYDEKDISFLNFVGRARKLGFSLEDVAALLALYRDRNRSSEQVKRLALQHVAKLDRKIAELTKMRSTIMELAQRCKGGDRPDCPIVEELADKDDSSS